MRCTLATGLACLLTLATWSGTAAQTAICTRIALPEDDELAGSPAFIGEPASGACDVVVYLPLAMADQDAVNDLREAAERQAAAREAAILRLGEAVRAGLAWLAEIDITLRPSSTPDVSIPEVPAPPQELRVGRSLGDADAPVRIEVFMDPQCPACGLYSERIEPLLIAGPVAGGTVFLTYKDFPFIGQESVDAAVAMRVAETLGGKFWDYHQLLYHNQQGENQGAFSRDRLADMAELIGIDRQAFLDALDDPVQLRAVRAEADAGAELGVNSTPSLFINGEIMRGVPTWEDLSQRIEAATK